MPLYPSTSKSDAFSNASTFLTPSSKILFGSQCQACPGHQEFRHEENVVAALQELKAELPDGGDFAAQGMFSSVYRHF